MARVRSVRKFTQRGHTPRRFNVDLTEGEVDFLIALLSKISGSTKSPRKYVRRILDPLVQAAGYNCLATDAYPLADGKIRLSDYSPREHEPEPDDGPDTANLDELSTWATKLLDEIRRNEREPMSFHFIYPEEITGGHTG